MRAGLALGLLIALCISANAAARGHHARSRVIDRPSQAVTPGYDAPSYVTPGGVRIYRDDSVPGGLRTDHDDPPSYDDPSRFGGG
jgi:hypothetical protein